MRDQDISFKEALNASVRRGLDTAKISTRPYRLPTRSLGAKPGVDLDRALALAGGLEDAEIVRKLSLRK